MNITVITTVLALSMASLFLQSCRTRDDDERSDVKADSQQPCDQYYTVQKGNTLGDIARKNHTSIKELLALNKGISDPNRIAPGDRIRLPGVGSAPHSGQGSTGKYHTLLQSYLGIPYGPIYPKGPGRGKEHVDCVSLIYKFAKDTGRKVHGSRGDQIYHRCTKPVSVITEQNADLSRLKSGDIVFIGHPWQQGESGVSILHLGIVDEPVRDAHGNVIDYTMIHAAGWYGKDRSRDYHGEVKEERMLSYLAKYRDNPQRKSMYIGRLL